MEWLGSWLKQEGNELTRPEKNVEANWENLIEEEGGEITCTRPIPEKEIYLLENFLSKQECLRLIDASNDIGFGKTTYPKHYRGNLRLITVDRNLAQKLYPRILKFVPHTVEEKNCTWRINGLNECWRIAKYHPCDRFGAHVDAYFRKTMTEKSMFTVNIYLNGDGEFVGGTTRFYQEERSILRKGKEPGVEELRVVPSAGLCLVFRQPEAAEYLHDGEEVTQGIKYLIRSDIMYVRDDENEEGEGVEEREEKEDSEERASSPN